MKIRIKTDIDSKRKWVGYYYWVYTLLIRRMTSFVTAVLGLQKYVEVLNILLWIVLVLITIDVFAKEIKAFDAILFIAVITIFFAGSLIWPNNYLISEKRLDFILSIFPFYFLGRVFKIDEKDIKNYVWFSQIIILLNTAIYYIFYVGMSEIDTDKGYNMGFAYVLLPHVLMCFFIAIKDKKIKDIAIAVLAGFLILFQGTRGPVLIMAVFVIWLFVYKNSTVKNILLVIAGGITVYVTLSAEFIEKFSLMMIQFGDKLGFSTRIFEKLLIAGALMEGNGRDPIHEVVWNSINDNKFLGSGPYGDVLAVKNSGLYSSGAYAHNIILEFLCDYGYVFGGVLLLVVFVLFINAYINVENECEKIVYIILGSILLKFIYSGSYLLEPEFYVWLGMAVTICKRKKAKYSNYIARRGVLVR